MSRIEPDLKRPAETREIEVDPRVVMAAERTLLAWVRTGLAMMGFGFVVARFGLFLGELARAGGQLAGHRAGTGQSHWFGVGLVLLGTWVLGISAIRHRRYIQALTIDSSGLLPNQQFGLIVTLALALMGLALAGYLVVMG